MSKWNIYEALPDLKQIYRFYKASGWDAHFQDILQQIPPADDTAARSTYLPDAVMFFNEIGDVVHQQNTEQLLHAHGQMSDLKKKELRDLLLHGHEDEVMDYLQNIPDALPWIISLDIGDDIQRKAFDRLWSAYATSEDKADNAWIEMQVRWNKENKRSEDDLKELYAQDKKQKENMAGLLQSHRIAKLFYQRIRTNPDYDGMRRKYPKAFASLDQILP